MNQSEVIKIIITLIDFFDIAATWVENLGKFAHVIIEGSSMVNLTS